MKKVLKLDNGEIAVVDSKHDETLFDAYYINGVEQITGTGLYLMFHTLLSTCSVIKLLCYSTP